MNERLLSFIRRIIPEYKKMAILGYFFVFLFSSLLFTFYHSSLTFADPDSFYHTKMALLMKDQFIVRDFPWLPYTVLKNYYIDHHFLYHLALIPFVSFFPPLVGVKIATIFFSSFSMVAFYWLLRRLSVRWAGFYTGILFITNAFVFRLNLAKAQGLSIIVIILGIYLICHKRFGPLFLLSFLYVWLYGGWPLILFLSIVYIGADVIIVLLHYCRRSVFIHKFKHMKIMSFLLAPIVAFANRRFYDGVWQHGVSYLKLLGAVGGGVIFGLVLNPYFPKNLFFYWQQIYEIAIVNYRSIIGVGGEWYPYGPLELIAHASLAFLLLIVGLTFFVLNIKKQNRESIFFLLLTFIFLALTLRSRRNVEYLIPFAVLFSAYSLKIFFQEVRLSGFIQELKEFISEQKVFLLALLFPLVVIPYIIVRDIRTIKSSYDGGIGFEKYQRASGWLLHNTQEGDIIFHSDWDEFPVLFYHNSHNYYIVGLDPTFMYKFDPDLYYDYERVTGARERLRLHPIIREKFKAQYVFVSYDRHESFDKMIQKNNLFREVYRDDESKIYQVL